jgi:integrase
LKSFKKVDVGGEPPSEDPGNPTVNFHGEKRSNQTPASSTDPYALFGKGRKERICPLWPQTAELLGALLAERGGSAPPDDPVFRNRRGARLTRFGVRYILRKHWARAQAVTPTLTAKHLHVHRIRHRTTVYLLRAGVDIVTIAKGLATPASPRLIATPLSISNKAKRHRKGAGHRPLRGQWTRLLPNG